MSKYLVDANLPKRVAAWNGSDFEFVSEIDQSLTDTQVWEYAKSRDQTIISKDADFSHRIMMSGPPPRVIHIRVGNMRLWELEAFLSNTWERAAELSSDHKLVNVFRDHLEAFE